MPQHGAEPEWRVHTETIYAAGYIFYGQFPPGGEEAEWGRGRRPEDEGPAVWVEVVVVLSVIGTYLLCVLPDYLAATTERATALALLPTCRPIAHGPPMCYEWERPAMAPPPGSGSGDSNDCWSHDDDEKTSMECFSTGLVRDAARTTGTALTLLPTCWFADAPPICYAMAVAPPPGSGSGDSDWSNNGGEKVAMELECFYGLVSDATRPCYEWERRPMAPPGSGSGDSDWSVNDRKATMECFYAVVRNAVKTCFGWSYDTIRPDGHGKGDPPPTCPKTENVLMVAWRN